MEIVNYLNKYYFILVSYSTHSFSHFLFIQLPNTLSDWF